MESNTNVLPEMNPRRCCLCWRTRNKYREVVSPMKEKHSKSVEKLLSIDVTNEGTDDGSSLFCFYCFDTVARLSLITDKLNEIQTLLKVFTISFSRHVDVNRKNATSNPNRTENLSFKNIAEQIVSSNGETAPGSLQVFSNGNADRTASDEEEEKESNGFENFTVNSCLENYEYFPPLKVPKGVPRVTYFQKALTAKTAPKKKKDGKRELRVKIEKLNLISGKTHGIFYCEKCRRELQRQSGYTVHNEVKHGIIKNGQVRQVVPTGKSSNLNSGAVNIANHSTSPEKLHKCIVCSRRFINPKDLKRHKETVHSGNKFPCQQCDMVFVHPTRLAFHVKVIHLKEIVFECNVCLKTFANKRNLVNHQKTQHNSTSAVKPAIASTSGS